MNKLLWTALSITLFVSLSQAQDLPKTDLALSFSHVQILKGYTIATEGASGSVAFNVNDWFGIAGDLGVYHGGPGQADILAATYTVGPRISFRKLPTFVPFAQILVGGAHFSIPIGGLPPSSMGNHPAFAIGGGADIELGRSGRVALRPQSEFFETPVHGTSLGNVRLSLGVVFHVGRRK
jgi:hypothetical protein